jgi:hypothetical protein
MSKKAASTLLNSALRTFPQSSNGFTPNRVLLDTSYRFNNKNELSAYGNMAVDEPLARSKWHYDKMRKAGWTENWNADFQKDHFVEVQHVIDLLAGSPLSNGGWADAPYKQLLHLSWYLNDRRNTWNIPASLNIRKGKIQLFQYIQPESRTVAKGWEVAQLEFLAEYLFSWVEKEASSENKATPFLQWLDLSSDMAAKPVNDVTPLTRWAGKRIFEELVKAYLGWSATSKIPASLKVNEQGLNSILAEKMKKQLKPKPEEMAASNKASMLEYATSTTVDGQ